MNASGFSVRPEETAFIRDFVASFCPADQKYVVDIENVRQGWGQMVIGKGLIAPKLAVGERVFDWGIAGHADSEIRLISNRPLKRIFGFAGVEANKDTLLHKAPTQVIFAVRVASETLWQSQPLQVTSPAEEFSIPLNAATNITLLANSPTPIALGHVNWGNLSAETMDGQIVQIGQPGNQIGMDVLPISFRCGGEDSRNILRRSTRRIVTHPDGIDYIAEDSKTGLRVICTARVYDDMPVCHWRLAIENMGTQPTPVLRDVKSLAIKLPFASGDRQYCKLLRGRGSFHAANSFDAATGALSFWSSDIFQQSYLPVEELLTAAQSRDFGSASGRCSDPWMPYFNVKLPNDGGLVFAIGWAGQWRAHVSVSKVEAGHGYFNARLLPGEKVELPSIYMLHYAGADQLRGNNLLRRFIYEKISPRIDGKVATTPISTMAWGGIDEQGHLDRIKLLKDKNLAFDVYWIDAGWYAAGTDNEHGPGWSENVGNWRFYPETFPHGTKPISDAAHKIGAKFLLWVEPERAINGTILPKEHPEWFLGKPEGKNNLLLNLGNPDACNWCIEYVSELISKHGVDVYREDFNIDPLDSWRSNDAADRQGITEAKAIAGLYRFWGEIRRRHPNVLIDNCSSGGRRLDIELLRYSIPLWTNDMQCFPGFNPEFAQSAVSGLSLWLPMFANGTQNHEGGDTYNFRSNFGTGVNIHLFYQRPWWPVPNDYPYDWLRNRISEVRNSRDCIAGDFYPLIEDITLSDKVWSASQYDRPDLGRGTVLAFRRTKCMYDSAALRLRNLTPDATYDIVDADSGKSWQATGRELMEHGLPVQIPEPRSSRLIQYVRK